MKALFVATVDSHIELFHLPYLELLKKRGYEVHVATNSSRPIPFCDRKIKLSIHRSPWHPANLRAIRQLRRVIETEKYDLIQTNTPMGGVVARLAAKRARRTGTRVIYMAHGLHFYQGAPWLNWLLFYPVEKWLARYTDTMVLINQEDYQLAKRKFRCPDIQYVPGVGIYLAKFQRPLTVKQKRALRTQLGLKEDDFVITVVGRLDRNKNQGLIIKAARELAREDSHYQLLLVGPDELKGKYQRQARRLQDHVHFLGARTDVPELLTISNLAVSTSRREGLPVNLLEAMAAGLPIVATDCRGNHDLVKSGRNGLLVPLDDSKALGAAIRRIRLCPPLCAKMAINGKKLVQGYQLPLIVKRMGLIYGQKA